MLTLKKTTFTTWFVILMVFLLPLLLWASSNPPRSRTGAPGESTCSSCHRGGLGGGQVAITSGSGNTYVVHTLGGCNLANTQPAPAQGLEAFPL